MLTIDKDSEIPLHVQLKNILQDEIITKNIKGKIPSERELMETYSISRATVRQALNALVNEGVLERVHGRGTYISLRPIEEWLGNLLTFNEVIQDMGMKPDIKILHQGLKSAPKKIAKVFELEQLYYVKRLRFANDIPIAVEEQYYPPQIGFKLAEYDLNNAAIYDLLELSIGVKLWEAEQVITSSTPTKEECELLNISSSQSLLVTERFISDINNNPVEYEKSVIRSDLYSFRIKLTRRRG